MDTTLSRVDEGSNAEEEAESSVGGDTASVKPEGQWGLNMKEAVKVSDLSINWFS